MDLPTCKACGQSVLDDDVEDCPFCGANLKTGKASGKPAAAPPPPPKPAATSEQPTPEQPTPEKPTPPPTPKSAVAAPAAPADDASTGDDNPIAADTATMQQAIPARRKPVKGCSYKVVCPMCETVGFVPRKAAGKDVRCANRECLVPVFTAPEIDTGPKEPEPPPKRGPSPAVLAVLGVVVAGAIGGGVWYFVLREPESPPEPRPGPPPIAKNNPPVVDPLNGDANNGEHTTKTNNNVPPPPDPKEIQQSALELMAEAAFERDRNRSRAFCRRLTAETYAQIGDFDEARRQLEQLKTVGDDVPFYQVFPLVLIAWKQLESGDREAAGATLNAAVEAAKRLPQYGREGVDAATELAAALVALGRADEAEELVTRIDWGDNVRQLSALWVSACALETFDADAVAEQAILPWSSPQRVAVTVGLFARGFEDEAVAWAKRAPTLEGKSETLAVWAAGRVHQAAANDSPLPQDDLNEAVADLPPAGKARVLASAAWAQLLAGDKGSAEQLLATAGTALQSIKQPPEFTLPGMKELMELQLPETDGLRTAVLAAAEIARVQDRLGEPKAAWESLQSALSYTRAMAPSLPAIESRLAYIQNAGIAAIEADLRRVLQLDSADQARTAAREYRKRCLDAEQAAQARFDFQIDLLARAAEWNVRGELWNEVRTRAEQSDDDRREPYFKSTLPGTLARAFQTAGEPDRVKEIETALAGGKLNLDPWRDLQQQSARLVAAGDYLRAARILEASRLDKSLRFAWTLRLSSRLASTGDPQNALTFVDALQDAIWREDCFYLVTARLARRGELLPQWELVQDDRLTPTERVSICGGLIAGLVAAPQPAQVSADAASGSE